MNNTNKTWLGARCRMALLVAASATQAVAMEEVRVSAQRIEQASINVPMAVSSIQGAELDAARLDAIEEFIPLLPGISGFEQGVSTPIIAVRGISSNSFGVGGEASVGVFVDNAYVGRIHSVSANLYDIERIEVLRGPQGTLYGRNASAGMIHVFSRAPQDESALSLRVGGGQFAGGAQAHDWTLVANEALSDRSFLRAALNRVRQQGYDRNVLGEHDLGGEDTWAGRLAWRFLPTEQLSATLRVSAQNTETGGFGYKTMLPSLAAAGGVSTDPYDGKMASDTRVYDNNRSRDVSLNLAWELSDGKELKSITAWHRNQSPNFFDVDGSAAFVLNASFADRESETWYQDIQLSASQGSIDWLLGASYFEETVSTDILFEYSDYAMLQSFGTCAEVWANCQTYVSELSYNRGDYRSQAVYADMTWHIDTQWFATLGARYTYDDKSYRFDAPRTVSQFADSMDFLGLSPNLAGYVTTGEETLDKSWAHWQPRAVLGYQWTADRLLYASLTRGYKAGGFRPSMDRSRSIYRPELVWNYELGYKARWDSLTLNAAAYYYDYEDYQVQVFVNGLIRTTNAPQVDGRGLELELLWQPQARWLLSATAGVNHSEFDGFVTDDGDLSGNTTMLSPQRKAALALTHTLPLTAASLELRAEWQYQSEQFFTVQNTDLARQGGYSLANLMVDYRPTAADWHAALVVHNLSDKEHLLFQQPVGRGLPVTQRAAPRYIGLEWGLSL